MRPHRQQSNEIASRLAICYRAGMAAGRRARDLGANAARLRAARGLSQQRMAELAGIPRATWASLESGAANPTLEVLTRAAAALNVSVEELIGPPRTACRLFPAAKTPPRVRQGASLRPLLPESIRGLEIAWMELTPGGSVAGTPHTAGTREYLTCQRGHIELIASGESWQLSPGDTLVFRGDQAHTYRNTDRRRVSTAISVVCFATD